MAKAKFYHFIADAFDSKGKKHTITLVGKFEQFNEKVTNIRGVPVETDNRKKVMGTLKFETKQMTRRLTIGYAICNPNDTFDENVGIRIAKSRIEKGNDVGSIETHSVTMLTKDAIAMELLTKLQHISNNIDDYIGYEKEDHVDFDPICDAFGY